MMIFDNNSISINLCAQRRHLLHPKLLLPISRFARTRQGDSLSRHWSKFWQQLLIHKAAANTFSQLITSTTSNISTSNDFFFYASVGYSFITSYVSSSFWLLLLFVPSRQNCVGEGKWCVYANHLLCIRESIFWWHSCWHKVWCIPRSM